MARRKNVSYFLNLQGGFSGVNNPGGAVYWVGASGYAAYDGSSPSDANDGLSPQEPFATIQAALNACTSGRGDIVMVLPGTYTVTAAITMSKDDVTLASALPVGRRERSQVIIANSTDVNTLIITGNDCKVIGIGFDDDVATATAATAAVCIGNIASSAVTVSNTIIRNCYIDMLGSDADRDGICVGLTADASDGGPHTLIEGCTILDPDNCGVIINVGSPYTVVRDCHIYDLVNLCLYGVEVLAVSCTVEHCDILVSATTGPGACIHNGVAAARLLAVNNTLHAWGADTTAILVINTATQRTANNWITATATKNSVDYLTACTSPSADVNWYAFYAADPAGTDATEVSVAGA